MMPCPKKQYKHSRYTHEAQASEIGLASVVTSNLDPTGWRVVRVRAIY